MIPISDPKRQLIEIQDSVMCEIKEVFSSGQYILGPNVETLENKIADKLGVSEAIAVANGTDALVLSLMACNIGEGDEVITTPFTFFATAEAIIRVGATPIFVDVEEETCNMDPKQITNKISPNTKAILPVHLFGQPADMNPIMKIARENNLYVIEDACQAFGASYDGHLVGSIGDLACFSFFPTKNLSTIGDGGIITTSNKAFADKIRSLRAHGSRKKYFHDEIGYNSRLDEIHAAILLQCLNHIDTWNQCRIKLACRYNKELNHLQSIHLLPTPKRHRHVYHLYCLFSPHREKIIRHLRKYDIATAIYYPLCLHLQKALSFLNGRKGDFPNAECLSEQIFAIPLFPGMTSSEQDHVISTIQSYEDEILC